MASVQGKVIAITGAASGIGLETAKLLAERGALVSLADVQEKALDEVAAAIKAANSEAKVITSVVDVRNQESVNQWIAKTVKEFGKLDGAANLAGVFKARPNSSIEGDTDDMWNWIIQINLMGVLNCMRAQIPQLGKGGSIVNAASILAIQGASGSAAYSASKHGVLGLSRSAAKDVGKRGIRVNCFAP
jgi:NAD(P)-dependent dehydrogenase (short-subunit alcohol dehydrogenase family)